MAPPASFTFCHSFFIATIDLTHARASAYLACADGSKIDFQFPRFLRTSRCSLNNFASGLAAKPIYVPERMRAAPIQKSPDLSAFRISFLPVPLATQAPQKTLRTTAAHAHRPVIVTTFDGISSPARSACKRSSPRGQRLHLLGVVLMALVDADDPAARPRDVVQDRFRHF